MENQEWKNLSISNSFPLQILQVPGTLIVVPSDQPPTFGLKCVCCMTNQTFAFSFGRHFLIRSTNKIHIYILTSHGDLNPSASSGLFVSACSPVQHS
jgi:hypothetical protein